ncbi:hypothetical protein F4802DRAFT_79580 [Xylaria palmicola]|nr:hypothetical protein F4802DRAFT_79580 [Xylaria palmicola]
MVRRHAHWLILECTCANPVLADEMRRTHLSLWFLSLQVAVASSPYCPYVPEHCSLSGRQTKTECLGQEVEVGCQCNAAITAARRNDSTPQRGPAPSSRSFDNWRQRWRHHRTRPVQGPWHYGTLDVHGLAMIFPKRQTGGRPRSTTITAPLRSGHDWHGAHRIFELLSI